MSLGTRIKAMETRERNRLQSPGMRILWECPEDGFTFQGQQIPASEAQQLLADNPPDLLHVVFVDEVREIPS